MTQKDEWLQTLDNDLWGLGITQRVRVAIMAKIRHRLKTEFEPHFFVWSQGGSFGTYISPPLLQGGLPQVVIYVPRFDD
jgi:hypothetical protein